MRCLEGTNSWYSWEFVNAQKCRKVREPSLSILAQKTQTCLGNKNPPQCARAINPSTFGHALRGKCTRRKSFQHNQRQKDSPSRTSLFLAKIFTATEEDTLYTLLPKFLHTSLQLQREKLWISTRFLRLSVERNILEPIHGISSDIAKGSASKAVVHHKHGLQSIEINLEQLARRRHGTHNSRADSHLHLQRSHSADSSKKLEQAVFRSKIAFIQFSPPVIADKSIFGDALYQHDSHCVEAPRMLRKRLCRLPTISVKLESCVLMWKAQPEVLHRQGSCQSVTSLTAPT